MRGLYLDFGPIIQPIYLLEFTPQISTCQPKERNNSSGHGNMFWERYHWTLGGARDRKACGRNRAQFPLGHCSLTSFFRNFLLGGCGLSQVVRSPGDCVQRPGRGSQGRPAGRAHAGPSPWRATLFNPCRGRPNALGHLNLKKFGNAT